MIKQYGMTLEEYDQLYEKQNGCCAICFIKEQPNKKLSIDHDHKTGKIRGLLCNPCNVSMGYAKEDIKILEKMIQYLEDHNE